MANQLTDREAELAAIDRELAELRTIAYAARSYWATCTPEHAVRAAQAVDAADARLDELLDRRLAVQARPGR